ncbi:geranylgeranylglyceryl/heptaprenylglyceryl phosphate synthase [Halalkalicoccus jeotgali]|uniref:phosphoglycerol geranylgeranyltransferase n=1 Tax=Halalkalicoccus jeotgali (strain DSM 18796 / CECT 7217 / JCM 14584 / KCTC 4019 / B3) TaxID=795797 RepID=D8J6L6_HALJB|nr:heptaprenylglyceryl phosphate synthase [Halalkalicoccus jeotgali]ADJ13893.1 geranylgeranylglyceryl phosphate synthase family protein [Halalkalicoccus jeotgali B3]ELY34060.1 geranylgeranylglyceryl phosphate synthase-like protein [Halalkalicoccus jeotgali B3]
MNIDWASTSHMTEIDPTKPLPADIGILEETDLVIIGGSDGVTQTATDNVVQQVRGSFPDLPLVQEPYASAQISGETTASVDWIVVPVVFNGDRDHFVGNHVRMLSQLGSDLEALLGQDVSVMDVVEKLVPVGYVIQNTNSKAASIAGVSDSLSVAQVRGAALATEIFYDFPIFHVDYAGMFGGTADTTAAATYFEDTALLYSGGIDSAQKATDVLAAGADAIVVNECFHENVDAFTQTTRISPSQI